MIKNGFDHIVMKYNISDLGGRGNVEREIRALQLAETRGEIDTLKCFIFDLDSAPTSLSSTPLVRVLQWKRRCIENFLINDKIIYDILRDPDNSKIAFAERGKVMPALKELALSQLNEVAAKYVYDKRNYENPGLRSREILGKTYTEMADVLVARLSYIAAQHAALDINQWKLDFEKECRLKHEELAKEWDTQWAVLCDGKRLFFDLHRHYQIRVSPLKLKKLIVERMRREQADDWILIEKFLQDALKRS